MTTEMLITPGQLSTLMQATPMVLLDGRDAKEYLRGHIAGAVNVREMLTYLSTSSSPDALSHLHDTFARLFGSAGLSGEEHAVVYEDAMDNGWGASCRGYFLLKYLGYPKVSILDGGLRAWSMQGLPLTTAQPAIAPRVFPLDIDPANWLATKDDVCAALNDPSTILVDVRDAPEWLGESSSPIGVDYCPRKGRIPGARWLEWRRLMEQRQGVMRFKSRQAILAECASIGVDQDSNVITYCFAGVRAANTLVALKEAGITNVRNYFASWNEWSRDPALPIASSRG
jgi:thiosulfate/3-mercaptopyruvate sulfurtransferase